MGTWPVPGFCCMPTLPVSEGRVVPASKSLGPQESGMCVFLVGRWLQMAIRRGLQLGEGCLLTMPSGRRGKGASSVVLTGISLSPGLGKACGRAGPQTGTRCIPHRQPQITGLEGGMQRSQNRSLGPSGAESLLWLSLWHPKVANNLHK